MTTRSHRNLIKVPVYSHYTCWGVALLSWLASRIVTTLLTEETGLKQEDDQITERCTSKRNRMSPKRLLRPFCWEECGGIPTTQHSYIMYGKIQPCLHPYYAIYSHLESLQMVSATCIPTKTYWQMFELRGKRSSSDASKACPTVTATLSSLSGGPSAKRHPYGSRQGLP